MARITSAERKALAAQAIAKADDAFSRLGALVFAEGMSREATLICLADAYGTSPSREREDKVGLRYKAARMAQALDSNRSIDEQIASCELLITSYTSPDVKEVPDGKMGRRTDAQEKAYRAAAQWLSKARADIGFGRAVSTKAKNDKRAAKVKAAAETAKRAPHHNDGGPNADNSAPVNKPEASPDKWTVERLVDHAPKQMASLLACLNRTQKDSKGAVPPALSTAIADAKALIDAACGVKPAK